MPTQRGACHVHPSGFAPSISARYAPRSAEKLEIVTKLGIWKPLLAGLCGTIVHLSLMSLKSSMGWLPAFQPYESLQHALGDWVGTNVSPVVPWMLSFVNGTAVLGVLFARINQFLPGQNGITKGLSFGLAGWALMSLVMFPLIGLGPFAVRVGLGVAPALFSLAMLLTYSLAMAVVYGTLERWR